MVHPGKKDWWLAGLLSLVTAALLVGGGTAAGFALVGGEWPLLIPATMLLAVGGMLLWVLVGTRYEITETSLVLQSGPFRWTIPLEVIEEVVPQRHWYGGPAVEVNLGLSVVGIRLRYRKPNGRLSWWMRISPEDRAAFLLELSERLPGLVVKDDGSLRRPADPGEAG
ncbi:MAG TPA: PH domain-containing protein [Gemmataceae bacterium]|nr:PH domain-containing protein [Gemmataceae bacterium]